MVTVPGSNIVLPGSAIPPIPSHDHHAWRGMPITIRLHEAIDVLRLARVEGELLGDWFALDGRNTSPIEFAEDHAMPRRGNEAHPKLKFAGLWTLLPGTELNIGRCGERFEYPGGGYQAEFLSGKLPVLKARQSVSIRRSMAHRVEPNGNVW